MVPVTADLIRAGRSRRGAWSRAQLTLIGVPWPLKRGWKRKVIGTFISEISAQRFVQLRNAHLLSPTPESMPLERA